MSEIKVCLGSVLGNVDLSVLVRTHSAGINIDVWVELLRRDLKSLCLEKAPERRRRNAFSESGYDSSGNEYVLCHMKISLPYVADL